MIFIFSSRTPAELPDFDWADRIVKKSGHMFGYALLVLSYWQIFEFGLGKRSLAWGFALLYAITDEFHQSFVTGRTASIWDVVIFDNLGALIALWLFSLLKRKRSDIHHPIAEKVNIKD